jgi:prepilin-type N-terminal cleavage/methylation domain-containing protein
MKKKSKAGMTLVEVIVAIAIFAGVALPLFAMFTNSMKMERRALVESLATYEAQLQMEQAYGMTAEEMLLAYNTGGDKVYYPVGLTTDPSDAIDLYYTYSSAWAGDELNLIRVTIIVGNDYFEVDATIESYITPAEAIA